MRLWVFFVLAAFGGCFATVVRAGQPEVPHHSELIFLDKGQRVFVMEGPGGIDVRFDPSLKHERFWLNDRKTTYVIAGSGTVYVGTWLIVVSESVITVNGVIVSNDVRSLVLDKEGKVIPHAFVR